MRLFFREKEFIPAPAGVHRAVCVDLVDLGKKTVTYDGVEKTQPRLKLIWQIDELMPQEGGSFEPRRFIVWKNYTASLHPMALLRKDLESWRGRPFTTEELEEEGFDFEKLIGVNCLLQVMHNNGTYLGRSTTFANVTSVLPPSKVEPPLLPDGHYVRVQDREKEQVPEEEKSSIEVVSEDEAQDDKGDLPF